MRKESTATMATSTAPAPLPLPSQPKPSNALATEIKQFTTELNKEDSEQERIEGETQFLDDFKRESVESAVTTNMDGEVIFHDPRIPLDDVIVEKRARTEFDPVLLEDLAQSLLTKGQLQPIVITATSTLIAGERRLRAAKILRDRGHTSWDTIWYSQQSSATEADSLILELEENFRRDDLPWQDQAKCIARLHDLYLTKRHKWEKVQTAAKLGVAPSHITKMLNLASKLNAELNIGDLKFHNIRTYEGAYQSLMRERERGVLAEMGRRADIKQREQNVELRKKFAHAMGDPEGTEAVPRAYVHGEGEGEESGSFLPVGLQSEEKGATKDEKVLLRRGTDIVVPPGEEAAGSDSKGQFFDTLFAEEGLTYVDPLNGDNDNDNDNDNLDEEDGNEDYSDTEDTDDSAFPSIRRTLGQDKEPSSQPAIVTAENIGKMFQSLDEEPLPSDDRPYKLTLGDCLEILPQIPDNSIHCIVSDPIWGIDVGEQAHFKSSQIEVHFDDSFSDLFIMIPIIVKELNRVLVQDAHIYIFTDSVMMPKWREEMAKYWDVRPSPLIWDKQSGYAVFSERTYMASYEMCMFAIKGAAILNKPMKDIFVHKRPRGDEKQVQTQKPVLLLREFIENSTQPGETVLDFMCGSGSTVGASIMSGRKGYGIEIDKDTHNIAMLKCADLMGQYLRLKDTVKIGAL